jgi:DNA-binding cell septation regulator SpoVG
MTRGLKVTIGQLNSESELKAFADVTFRVKFGEITVRRFKILQGEARPWVAFPQIQYYQGFSAKYVNLLHMNQRVQDLIKNQIIKAYRDAISEKK